MVNLSPIIDKDPTLEAADAALVAAAELEELRPYLGMSSIGESCSRKLWYRFRWAKREEFDADTLKRFRDGHKTEVTVIDQLRLAKGITVTNFILSNGAVPLQQIGFRDIDGHFAGHIDGYIEGLLQAPKTKHILEIKATSDKKFAELKKAKLTHGEKGAIKAWNATYYAQIVLYMFYAGLTRAYHVVATAGGRDWQSVRTESNDTFARQLIEKARRIIYAQTPPEGVSTDESWFECRYCSFADICHKGAMPDRTCRSCAHSSPAAGGTWTCALQKEMKLGCEWHCFIPALVPGEITASTETSVTYKMKSGEVWTDGKA